MEKKELNYVVWMLKQKKLKTISFNYDSTGLGADKKGKTIIIR